MKFAMSYSCGKDSTLALHRMLEAGHDPVALIVMVNEAAGRSYFHGATGEMLRRYSESLGIPLICCPSSGDDYEKAFEEGLLKARGMGAEAVCFGDIDIEEHRSWDETRCENCGLVPFFPLWQQGRENLVHELIGLGYRCIIKSVNTELLPESLLGRYLDEEAAAEMKAAGIDVCGENGEYHTLAADGPVFAKPLDFGTGEIIRSGNYSAIDIF